MLVELAGLGVDPAEGDGFFGDVVIGDRSAPPVFLWVITQTPLEIAWWAASQPRHCWRLVISSCGYSTATPISLRARR